jgi:ABC-2 type transport system ATP-binding protein
MTDALVLSDLSKTYRNGFQALKGIDLTVPEGEFYALLGLMVQVNRQRSVSLVL